MWPSSSTPATIDVDDSNSVELGLKFRAGVAGQVTGVRFYKSAANTGVHTGTLWAADGTKLGQVTFTGETGSGWQQADFAVPVTIAPNTTYVVSYHAPGGHYSATSGYFASGPVTNGALTALADGADGGNGVYAYGGYVTFPTSTYQSCNYWVDPVFAPANSVDTTPPTVTSVSPSAGATGVQSSAPVVVSFSEALAAATTTNAVTVKDAAGQPVPGSSVYSTASQSITFTPSSAWAPTTTYSASVATSVTDAAGNALASPYTWSFTTAAAAAPSSLVQGPGGPVLVVYDTRNPFSEYYAEILRAEGLNSFASAPVGSVTAGLLSQYAVVILGDVALTDAQVTLLSDWVTGGGNLVAMHPDKKLAGLLGLVDSSATQVNGYLKIDTTTAPGAGITAATMQYHGSADLYDVAAGTRTVATLYTGSQAITTHPAVTLRNVGTSGGQAVAFTYDLARSVVYTRQGNPAWAGQERDGLSPIRPDDLFYGAAAGDKQPDWVNLEKVAIPQADEQQRLLSNIVELVNQDKSPLPKFWYFPKGVKAVIVMAGDDHGTGGTRSTMDSLIAASPASCSADDWTCLRATSYMYVDTSMTNTQAARYESLGFDIGAHVSTGCENWTPDTLAQAFQNGLTEFRAAYPSLPPQKGSRTHCIVWSDWASEPKIEASFGIRMDLNYYYWPGAWVQNRPGYMTGSGLPMRYADSDGSMMDVFQEPSSLVNENGVSYPAGIQAMLQRALGADGYYGAIGTHYDYSDSFATQLAQAAVTYGIPAVSVQQMLDWTDARNASSFDAPVWNGTTLTFDVTVATGARSMMRAMLPVASSKGTLSALTKGGTPLSFTVETIKGIEYALFPATTGTYAATYTTPAPDTTAPTVTSVSPVAGATGVSLTAPVVVTFSEALATATTASAVTVKNAAGQSVAGSTTYSANARTITFTPSSPWAPATTYTATVATTVTDTAGNALASPYTTSFTTSTTTAQSLWAPSMPSGVSNEPETARVQLGVQVRPAVAGTIGAILFYKSYNDASAHTMTLYSSSGTALATATTSSETATGWQTAAFTTPVTVTAGTTYTASYLAASGRYSYTTGGLTAGYTNGNLTVPTNGGVYTYGGGFPTSTWSGTNYWVDILFTPGSPPVDKTPPTVTSVSPAAGATGVSLTAPVVVTFSEALAAATTSNAVTVKNAAGQGIAGSMTYNASAHTITFAASSSWAPATTYTATVATTVTDTAGNALASPYTWSFTTGTTIAQSLWAPTTPSGVSTSTETKKVQLGVKVRPTVAGTINAILFYKSYNDATTHTMTLYSSTGATLATASSSNETATGWQKATFTTPVAVTAATTYTASYLAPAGRYSYTTDILTSGYVNGYLTVPANGGVFTYGGGMPTRTWNGASYWVDVLFTRG